MPPGPEPARLTLLEHVVLVEVLILEVFDDGLEVARDEVGHGAVDTVLEPRDVVRGLTELVERRAHVVLELILLPEHLLHLLLQLRDRSVEMLCDRATGHDRQCSGIQSIERWAVSQWCGSTVLKAVLTSVDNLRELVGDVGNVATEKCK